MKISNIINILLIDAVNLNTLCKHDHMLCWKALAQLWRVNKTWNILNSKRQVVEQCSSAYGKMENVVVNIQSQLFCIK